MGVKIFIKATVTHRSSRRCHGSSFARFQFFCPATRSRTSEKKSHGMRGKLVPRGAKGQADQHFVISCVATTSGKLQNESTAPLHAAFVHSNCDKSLPRCARAYNRSARCLALNWSPLVGADFSPANRRRDCASQRAATPLLVLYTVP